MKKQPFHIRFSCPTQLDDFFGPEQNRLGSVKLCGPTRPVAQSPVKEDVDNGFRFEQDSQAAPERLNRRAERDLQLPQSLAVFRGFLENRPDIAFKVAVSDVRLAFGGQRGRNAVGIPPPDVPIEGFAAKEAPDFRCRVEYLHDPTLLPYIDCRYPGPSFILAKGCREAFFLCPFRSGGFSE